MTLRDAPKQSGFTLVELIVAIVVVAVFSAIMLVLLSDSFIKSMDSVRRFSKSSVISEVMANIIMDYEPYPKWKASTSYSATNKVFPTGMNGLFHICTVSGTSGTLEPQWRRDSVEMQDGGARWVSGIWKPNKAYVVGDMVIPDKTPNGNFYRCTVAGTSGTTEPTWPVKSTNPAAVDGVQWVRLLEYLKSQIGAEGSTQDNNYGKYNVVKNRFVKFVSNEIQPIATGEDENILEVQIKNDEGDTLTTLFTTQIN